MAKLRCRSMNLKPEGDLARHFMLKASRWTGDAEGTDEGYGLECYAGLRTAIPKIGRFHVPVDRAYAIRFRMVEVQRGP